MSNVVSNSHCSSINVFYEKWACIVSYYHMLLDEGEEGRGKRKVAVFQLYCNAGLDKAMIHFQIGT